MTIEDRARTAQGMAGRDAAGRPGTREITLRAAVPADRDLVLEWANDPVTRGASFHPAPIDPDIHDAWYRARLADPGSRIWIGELDGRPIGQVRARLTEDGCAEIGISVASEWRGLGLAAPLLLAGADAARHELGAATLVAAVRPDNDASLRVFRGQGFIERGAGTRAGVACVLLEKSTGG